MKHGGGYVLVWDCFSGQGIGDLKRIKGKMDQKMYRQTFIRHGVPSGLHLVGRGFVYQQENDLKHTSKLCKNYLDKKVDGKLQKLDWPPAKPRSQSN